MVSTELLRQFSFFGFMNNKQLKSIAMISEEITLDADALIVESGTLADRLFFLIKGSAAYYCVVKNELDSSYHKEYFINDINPGEIFGISALIEPYVYTATIRANEICRMIKIDARNLHTLCETDIDLAYGLMNAVAKAAMQRLDNTRVHLVSARISLPVLSGLP